MTARRRGAAWELYDWLLARAATSSNLRRVLLGLQWSAAELDGVGLCFSPRDVPRTLAWSGSLQGQPARELCDWVRHWDPAQACVGLATINAIVNHPGNSCAARAQPLGPSGPGHLRVFEHFAPQLRGAKVVVVGRYPGIDTVFGELDHVCLERRNVADSLPDLACEYVLPEADWVFITASALANKSLPRLLDLSRGARVVLMGPSLPWLAEWADFGVDYLAGVLVRDAQALWQVAAEGGGTRLFERAVEYRLLRVS